MYQTQILQQNPAARLHHERREEEEDPDRKYQAGHRAAQQRDRVGLRCGRDPR
jgi:hypothetical protein